MGEVTVAVVHTELEAARLCGLLRADGIGCYSTGVNSVGYPTPYTPRDIVVDEQDAARAAELLAASS
jgi:hypothetical protein